MKSNYKRLAAFIFALGIIVTFSGCVSKIAFSDIESQLGDTKTANSELTSKNEELNKEIKTLTTENETLKTSNSSLSIENEDLKIELDEYVNGATNLLYQIKQYYEEENYDKVIDVATTLHQKFSDSQEDMEGQKLMTKSQKALAEEKNAEEEAEKKAKEEAEKGAKEKAREIIRITKLSFSEPNSAGGVDLFIGFKNMSDDKVVKYANFTITPYNAVGDAVRCDIRRESTQGVQTTGPFEKGEGLKGDFDAYWECLWYSYDIETVVLDKIVFEYMDGTLVTLEGKDLEYVQY